MGRALVVVALLMIANAADARAATQRPELRPNIVFVLIDDMGWADGGCFGSSFYRTPNLDRLASSGMRFTQAYASCAVCSPTRAAIMTGKYPARLHITDWIGGEPAPAGSRFRLPTWQKHLPLEEETIAEVLKKAGYATAHIGKWHLGGAGFLPQHQGFDVNVAGGGIGHPASYFWPFGAEGHSHRVPGLAESGGTEGEYLTDRLTAEALRFVESNRAVPFYLNLAHYAVHAPLEGKPELVELAGEQPAARGQGNAVYSAMLSSVDESVGRILRRLDELQLSDRTVIIFTSDNGGAVHFGKPPATSNWPLRSGKGNPYEGGLRVPLLVRAPGITRAGSVCAVPVISHDYFPTLLELARTAPEPERAVDGVSILPLLKGGSRMPRTKLFWHYPHYWNGGRVAPYSVVLDDSWKLIRFYETGREELYDLDIDASEQSDKATERPEIRKRLGDGLDAWLRAVGAQMPIPKPE